MYPLVGHTTGASALSPKITLQLRFSDRDPETVTLGPGRTIVGRESGDILLHDREASALHAEIEFTKGHVIVRDLGSSNGTWREGKRLPQFALYEGQSFRCGTTDITLEKVLGADAPSAGGTASGGDADAGPGASSTLPSAAIVAASSVQTVSRGIAPAPSSTATAPGGVGPNTLLGGPIPAPPVAPKAAPTPPAPSAARPTESSPPVPQSTPIDSAPAAPPSSATADGPTPTPAAVIAPAAPEPAPPIAPPPGVPLAVPAAASVPVANAVIKLGDARPQAPGRPPPRDRGALRKLAMRIVAGTVGIGLLGGIIFGIYSLITGRNQAFLRDLAREMPQDTVGVIALASPRQAIELFGDEVPPAVREQLVADLGIDPFSTDALQTFGLDPEEPMGISLLDGTGMVAVSVGVADKDVLRSSLSTKAAEIIQAGEDLRWIDRSFGDTPGLWLDEPMAVAALLPDERAIFVLGGTSEDVARHATRIAETRSGKTLADSEGFGELAREPGSVLMAMYIDGPAGRSALPGKGMEVIATRMALADIDGFAMMLSEDDEKIHLSWQTVMHDGVRGIAMLEDVSRKGDLLKRIPGPVLAGFDGVFAPDQIKESLGIRGPFGLGVGALEEGFREETSLDLRTDILGNLDGRYGVVLKRLSLQDDDEVAMMMWAGVVDEDAAKQTAERFFAKMESEVGLKLQQVSGTTVYTIDDGPGLSYFVHGGVLWAAVGKVDLAGFIDGSGEPFRDGARTPAIKKATAKGGQFAGFADIKEIIGAIRAGDVPISDEEFEQWDPILSPLEALTIRGQLDGRTFVVRTTLHTTVPTEGQTALGTLVQGIMKVAGEEVAADLARKRRRERCEKLIDHIVELMKTELASASDEDDLLDRRYDLLTECRSDETTESEIDCMMEAKNLEGLTRCEDGNGEHKGGDDSGTPIGIADQPEPIEVPYVEDIWPNTTPAGTDSGRPDPSVNYAVGVGMDPQIRGAKDALVTVVMFGDFQCPYCKRILPTLDQLLASDSEVRVVFRHQPLSMHEQGENAALAAIAASRQGKFWEMHDKLFDNQTVLHDDIYSTFAADLSLDITRFERDFHDSTLKTQIATDAEAAKRFGAQGTPSFFVNGRYLRGNQPLHAFTALVDEEKDRATRFVERRGNTRRRLYEDMVGKFAGEVVAPPSTPVAVAVAETRYVISTAGLPRRGSAGYVPVEIVECGDFDCPFCERATQTLERVLKDYEGKVALFWLHNPLSFHAGAEPAARAATAADKQGKFWEMHDALFEDRLKRSEADFISAASTIGIDTKQFELDLSDATVAATVTEQQKRCVDNDARGTPAFFINGRLLSGAQPYSKFKEVIDQELAGGI